MWAWELPSSGKGSEQANLSHQLPVDSKAILLSAWIAPHINLVNTMMFGEETSHVIESLHLTARLVSLKKFPGGVCLFVCVFVLYHFPLWPKLAPG